MLQNFNSKYLPAFIHIFIWSLLFILPHLFISSDSRIVHPGFFPSSWFVITNLYNAGLFYLNVLVFYPLFFNKSKWPLFLLFIAATLAVSYYLKLFFTKIYYPEVRLDVWARRILFFPGFAFLVVSSIYKIIGNKIKYDKKQKEIYAEQLSIKLKFLRSQISPHFIFNVLTNLVSLARKRSEQLEPALIKLSELMRYMLYESDAKKVALSEEVTYLKNYISLQELRFGHDVAVKVNISVAENEAYHIIEPMMLIPFVENAFKHGMGVDEPLIEIKLEVRNGKLKFDVKNKYDNNAEENKEESSGIGLENVRTRLMLLYQHEHTLIIHKENNFFHVHLNLQLNDALYRR